MVARKFNIQHGDSSYDLDYDTDDGLEVLQYQLYSLTSVPPDQQKICGSDENRVVLDDSDLHLISDKLRLASMDEAEEQGDNEKPDQDYLNSDEELARRLQAEEELLAQRFVNSEHTVQVEQRIRPYVNQVLMYEDSHRQEAARKMVPVDKLEEKAMVSLAREGYFNPTKAQLSHAFLLQLLFWFKQSFRWVNAPPCDICTKETINMGMGVASNAELQYGATRVEIYRCKLCSSITRFPRYNDPLKLLETRKGRCGEWANCFTLYCRAFGYDSRLILDFTDHVWTECFSLYLGSWMHLDPCEGIYDNPLLYEKGWNKKLDYVIAIAKDGVYDVTKRYTRKWDEVLSRRVITTEPIFATALNNITRERRIYLTSEIQLKLDKSYKIEVEEIERNLFSNDGTSASLPGRQSGNKEWRLSRSEFGADNHQSIYSNSCPVRRSVDLHVTRIYNAFLSVLNQFVEEAIDRTRATEILETLKNILISLKNSHYKTRRTKISPTNLLLCKMIPSFHELFDALSLKTEMDIDGSTNICIASDPVKTSVALPVIFHALDDLIHNISCCEILNAKSLAWPLLKLNRICSGSVLSSGEELPFGISTSAFDGTRLSKWEEPNGATGCWILYKVSNNQMHELVAYELMSANDAPERDPKDWVLEGSEDGGANWKILDKQSSQEFDKRYQRKTFEIKSPTFLANAFRFRFLTVNNAKSNPRFQIGSIDLYARTEYIPETE